jgi:hypothetical protein
MTSNRPWRPEPLGRHSLADPQQDPAGDGECPGGRVGRGSEKKIPMLYYRIGGSIFHRNLEKSEQFAYAK